MMMTKNQSALLSCHSLAADEKYAPVACHGVGPTVLTCFLLNFLHHAVQDDYPSLLLARSRVPPLQCVRWIWCTAMYAQVARRFIDPSQSAHICPIEGTLLLWKHFDQLPF
jgi:hypothetical protein